MINIIGIYKIRNIVNDKFYLGSSKDCNKRKEEHIRDLNKNKHHSYKLQAAWKEYGENKFVFEIEKELTENDDLTAIEQEYLDKYKPHIYGYNVSDKALRYEIFCQDKGYLFKTNAFQKRMYNEIKLSEVVKDRLDFARTHLLAENIYKNTNAIMVKVSTRKVRPADIDDISNIISLSKKKTKEFLSRIKKLNILAEKIEIIGNIKQTKYIFNPLYFNSSKYLDIDLYFLFKDNLDLYLSQEVIDEFYKLSNIQKDEQSKNNS